MTSGVCGIDKYRCTIPEMYPQIEELPGQNGSASENTEVVVFSCWLSYVTRRTMVAAAAAANEETQVITISVGLKARPPVTH